MSTRYMIYDKYAYALGEGVRELSRGNRIHIDAARLVLRLALDELAESTPTPDYAGYIATIETLGADLERLQTAANAEVADLRQQIAQMDADNAALIRRNKDLADELKQARLDRQETAFHASGAAPSTINNQIPLDYSSLSSENVDWCDGLDAGRQQWRSLPKQTRLELVRWILSHNDAMTMATFDNIRPGWMPTAGTHTKVFNMTWEQLNDFTVDLEITR